ncbi:hypothetical protein [Amnibacterium sp.]|uniref:hypothetical protein n=1 Tax=Amnibacterium sp. TaxID=1872496 RepID=UPI003F7B7381
MSSPSGRPSSPSNAVKRNAGRDRSRATTVTRSAPTTDAQRDTRSPWLRAGWSTPLAPGRSRTRRSHGSNGCTPPSLSDSCHVDGSIAANGRRVSTTCRSSPNSSANRPMVATSAFAAYSWPNRIRLPRSARSSAARSSQRDIGGTAPPVPSHPHRWPMKAATAMPWSTPVPG